MLQQENPPDWVNLGTGVDHSILEIANLVKDVVGFQGEITNDTSKPDGMPLKRLDISVADELGWRAKIPLEDGIQSAYDDFCQGLADNTVRL